jgi:hypothetical protein
MIPPPFAIHFVCFGLRPRPTSQGGFHVGSHLAAYGLVVRLRLHGRVFGVGANQC